MTGENGYPETPDWRVDPHPSPFDPPVREVDPVLPPNIELGCE